MSVNISNPNNSISSVNLNCNMNFESKDPRKVFFGLKSETWKQVIDGKFHRFGPMVFDYGLHNGPKELGFVGSLMNGFSFSSDHMGEEVSLQFYKELHSIVTKHFDGKCTITTGEEGGKFKTKRDCCRYSIAQFEPGTKKDYETVKKFERMLLDGSHERKPQKFKKLSEKCALARNQINQYRSKWKGKIDALQQHLADLCASNSISSINTVFNIDDDSIRISYREVDPEKMEETVQTLFNNYNDKIRCFDQIAVTEKQGLNLKIGAVAELFQMLDWLHPFPDGQGRTDLLLQAKLLTDIGANPAILNEPYFSSCTFFSEWKEYLLEGMQEWKNRKSQIEAG